MVGKRWTSEMRQFISESGLNGSALELTGVSDEDLRALYSTASLLLFPSLQEGFGWPIVEAQACGCPVATVNRAPMNEVAGDAAIYIDPENWPAAAVILSQALKNSANMRERSIANAARFRFGMIESYVSLYERVVAEMPERASRELSHPVPRPSACSTDGVQ